MSTDPRTWIAALRGSHDRLAALAGPLTASELAGPSYAEDWTIAQVLSHLGSGAEIAQLSLAAALGGPPVDRAALPAIWAAWDGKDPGRQAADCLSADEAHVSRLEGLSDAELSAVKLEVFGITLDAAGLVWMRLGEHAAHTWDVAVALDPAAAVSADAAALLAPKLERVARWAARPTGRPFAVRLRATDADADFLLDAGEEAVSLGPWPGGSPAAAPAPGEIALPAEALVRLVYGRLDPASAPAAVQVFGGADLGQARAVFPGF